MKQSKFFIFVAYALMAFIQKDSLSAVPAENGVVGVLATCYVWIVPGTTGVILIDAGNDATAKNIFTELTARSMNASHVKAIILTHGHADHFNGVVAFPNTDIYIMPQDSALVNKPNIRIKTIRDSKLTIDGQEFAVHSLPGHTAGTAAFLWKTLCFTGDIITRTNGAIAYGPDNYSRDPAQNRASAALLPNFTFNLIATGHGSTISRADLLQFLGVVSVNRTFQNEMNYSQKKTQFVHVISSKNNSEHLNPAFMINGRSSVEAQPSAGILLKK